MLCYIALAFWMDQLRIDLEEILAVSLKANSAIPPCHVLWFVAHAMATQTEIATNSELAF